MDKPTLAISLYHFMKKLALNIKLEFLITQWAMESLSVHIALLKIGFLKQRRGNCVLQDHPKHKAHLAFVLFVLNFLQTDAKGQSAADGHWHPVTSNSYAMVKWWDPLIHGTVQTLF